MGGRVSSSVTLARTLPVIQEPGNPEEAPLQLGLRGAGCVSVQSPL
jgi:hypothetical protein